MNVFHLFLLAISVWVITGVVQQRRLIDAQEAWKRTWASHCKLADEHYHLRLDLTEADARVNDLLRDNIALGNQNALLRIELNALRSEIGKASAS